MTDTGARPAALPAGVVVVIAGPDGAGKSSLAGAVVEAGGADRTLWLHHRPRLLPSRRGGLDEPVTDPYGEPPYNRVISTAKVAYYWIDYVLGWLLSVRPVLRDGGAAVIERGWWDLAADPRRYRLHGVDAVVRALGALLPRPICTFVLTAPVEVLLQRTEDNLTAAELRTQLDAQRRVFGGRASVTFLDAREPVARLQAEVMACLTAGRLRSEWAGVPRRSEPRWLLPRRPRVVAAGALRIHRPMAQPAAVVWRAARVGALLGASRFLPTADLHAVPDLQQVAPWVPGGGGVAVARSRHGGRHHAIIVDARGRPVAHVKLAADEAGRAALAREAENLRRYATLLSAPLRAPGLMDEQEGMLVTEAAAWDLLPAPWRLEPTVANRLGRLYRASATTGERGLAHGDVAPWNLLPAGGEWVLVDWESATPDAPAFFDVLHWVVMAQAHLRRPGLATVRAGLDGAGWIGACLRAYAEGAGLPATGLRGRLNDYLDEVRSRTDADSAEGAREIAVHRALRGPGG